MPAESEIRHTYWIWKPPISNSFETVPSDVVALGARHIGQILHFAFEHSPSRQALIVFDKQSPLALALTEAYRHCLPEARFIDFGEQTPESIRVAIDGLAPLDLIVLIQSANFRLEAFRLRVELFKRFFKVIEHPHLARMQGQEAIWYIDSLAYDPNYYRTIGSGLKDKIDRAQSGVVVSGDGQAAEGHFERLVFASGFETAKLNTGDYRNMKNIGGQFPIGEVFTEAKDLESVQGRVRIFVFADIDYMANQPAAPITLVIANGRVVDTLDSTPEFEKVLANIRADEGEVWIRELGFGLNRAFTPQRMVRDIGTLERMCGIHLSLGAKHAVYQKPAFKRKETKHHVDVFVETESVLLDDEVIFKQGEWILPTRIVTDQQECRR